MQEHNPVSAPAHYTVYPVQPIAITRHLGFCLGNAVKYVLRAPYKGGAEDCEKALRYLEFERQTPEPPIALPAFRTLWDSLYDLTVFLRETPAPQPWLEEVAEAQADFLDALGDYLEEKNMPNLENLNSLVRVLSNAVSLPRCRVCGCTDLCACEGGCSWVEPDLCSSCVDKA